MAVSASSGRDEVLGRQDRVARPHEGEVVNARQALGLGRDLPASPRGPIGMRRKVPLSVLLTQTAPSCTLMPFAPNPEEGCPVKGWSQVPRPRRRSAALSGGGDSRTALPSGARRAKGDRPPTGPAPSYARSAARSSASTACSHSYLCPPCVCLCTACWPGSARDDSPEFNAYPATAPVSRRARRSRACRTPTPRHTARTHHSPVRRPVEYNAGWQP